MLGEANIHRSLFIRLAAVWLGVSLISSTVELVIQIDRVDEIVVGLTIGESNDFLTEHSFRLTTTNTEDKKILDDAVKKLVADRFVIVEIYDKNQNEIIEHESPEAKQIESELDSSKHSFPALDESVYEKFWIDGTVYVQTLVPMKDAQSQLVGYFEGVYKVENSEINRIIADTILTLVFIIFATLAITVILYPVVISLNKESRNKAKRLLRANVEILNVLGSAIAKKDSDTHAHNFRVTIYAVRLAELLSMNSESIRQLIKGAFLHDVGKIAISDSILLKPGKLDEEEFSMMTTHVDHGIDIVSRSDWLNEACDVVRCHHEKYNGKGYPRGLTGEEIPTTARVFAIADVFDALTSKRPYKDPFSLEQTLTILSEGRGTHFDPDMLDTFFNIAPSLHNEYAGREDVALETELEEIITHYFST